MADDEVHTIQTLKAYRSLYVWGVFDGTSDTDYRNRKAPVWRTGAFIRRITNGQESEVLNTQISHCGITSS